MKKRIISAAVMLIICIPLLIIGGIPFKIGMGLLASLAYKEIISLKGVNNYPKGILLIGLVVMLGLVYSNKEINFMAYGLNYKMICFILLMMFIPVVFYYSTNKYTAEDAFKLTSFIFFIGLTLNLMMNLLLYEPKYFYLLIIVTVLTDTFAYFTGVFIGKHKVTKISPKKSLEGFIGGVVMSTILTSIYYMTVIGAAPITKVVPVILVLSLTCEIGDLFYSAIKREKDIKDFSNLIPGHGGILDRIDSLTFVCLAFILLYGII